MTADEIRALAETRESVVQSARRYLRPGADEGADVLAIAASSIVLMLSEIAAQLAELNAALAPPKVGERPGPATGASETSLTGGPFGNCPPPAAGAIGRRLAGCADRLDAIARARASEMRP